MYLKHDGHAQLIFQGKTFAVEPSGPFGSAFCATHSTTLMACLTWLDRTVHEPLIATQITWICFKDLRTVHVSHRLLALHRSTSAHNSVVCVPPNTAARCQPPNRATGSLSRPRGRLSARFVDREIERNPDGHCTAFLHCFRAQLPHAIDPTARPKDTAMMHHHTAAWTNIVCTDAEGVDIPTLATAPQGSRVIAAAIPCHRPSRRGPSGASRLR